MIRQHLIMAGKTLGQAGLFRGSAGNLSARATENGIAGFLVTPTGADCSELTTGDLVFLDRDGQRHGMANREPTSEWRLHRDILAARPEFNAVIHAHSPFATALACLGNDVPAFHYMIARFGGSRVRCAPYATFGTQELSNAVQAALDGRSACLMANHGFVVCADNVTRAAQLAIEFEDLCGQYWRACCIGTPILIGESEMQVVLERFVDYGRTSHQA